MLGITKNCPFPMKKCRQIKRMFPNKEDIEIMEWMKSHDFPWKFLSKYEEDIARMRYERLMGSPQTARKLKVTKQAILSKLKRIRRIMRKYMDLPDNILLYSLDRTIK